MSYYEPQSKIASRQLCDFIESKDSTVFGANYSNLPHLLRIFADVFLSVAPDSDRDDCEAANAQTVDRMRHIIRQIHQGVSAELVQGSFSMLSEN